MLRAMRFLTANDRPGRYPPSLYAEEDAPEPALAALDEEISVDLCVVGGGYAGCSAALHAAQAGKSVALLEANRIGWGASGRNGGHLGRGPRQDIRLYEKLTGRDDARKIWTLSCEANRLTQALIRDHDIACDLAAGSVEAAWKPAHAREMVEYAAHVARYYDDDGLVPLDAEALRARCDSPCYHGGLADEGAGHLNPLRYALGLGRAAQASGAQIFECAPAQKLAPGRVETARGAVTAERVIVACNGYLDDLAPKAAARLMPLNNFICATEPLDAPPLPQNDCVADSKFVLNYYRMDAQNRLVFGGGETYSPRFPADIAGFVRPHLERVFPQLKGVRLSHGWGGTLAVTRWRAPLFQRLDAQTLLIGGWSGSGIHMATLGGKVAAEAAFAPSPAWEALARAPCPRFPGGAALRPVLAALAMRWFALRDTL